jgi:hypothetical protein
MFIVLPVPPQSTPEPSQNISLKVLAPNLRQPYPNTSTQAK